MKTIKFVAAFTGQLVTLPDAPLISAAERWSASYRARMLGLSRVSINQLFGFRHAGFDRALHRQEGGDGGLFQG